MATIILAVSYDKPQKFIQLAAISDDDIKKLTSAISSQLKLLKFLDPYDNTFFNRKQIERIQYELNTIAQENNDQIIEIVNTLKQSIDQAFLTEEYYYLVFLGD